MRKKSNKPKKSKRSSTKFPNLRPDMNLRSRYEEIEDLHSYMDKLDEDCKAWLDKFSKEYVNASFDHDDPLHSPEQQKSVYDKNNARNRCVLTRYKAFGAMNYLGDKNTDTDVMDQDDLTQEESDYNEVIERLKRDKD